jgi:hypothetical protein
MRKNTQKLVMKTYISAETQTTNLRLPEAEMLKTT